VGGDVFLLGEHLVTDGAHFESDLVFLLFIEQFGSQNYSDSMAHPSGCTFLRVTEDLEQKPHVVHLVEVDACVLLTYVELGCEPSCWHLLTGVFLVICIHLGRELR